MTTPYHGEKTDDFSNLTVQEQRAREKMANDPLRCVTDGYHSNVRRGWRQCGKQKPVRVDWDYRS